MAVSATDYAAGNNYQVESGIDVAGKYLSDVHPTDYILNLGSGTGEISYHIHKITGCYVTGLDILEDMTIHSNYKYGGEKVTFVTADMQENMWVEFNWVVSFNAIHWVDHIDNVIGNIWKVLHPGGKVLAYYMPRDYNNDVYAHIEQLLNQEKWSDLLKQTSFKMTSFQTNFNNIPEEMWTSNVDSFIQKFRKKGFQVTEMIRIPVKYWVSKQILKPVLPVLNYLQAEHQNELLDDLIEHLCSTYTPNYVCLVCEKPL